MQPQNMFLKALCLNVPLMLEILTHRKHPFTHASEIINYYNKMYISLHAFFWLPYLCIPAYIACILHMNKAISESVFSTYGSYNSIRLIFIENTSAVNQVKLQYVWMWHVFFSVFVNKKIIIISTFITYRLFLYEDI